MKRLLSLLAVLILVSGCAGLGRGGAGGSALIGPDGKPITPGTAADFVARAKDRVFFELDKYDLSAEAVEGLKAQVAWLAQYKDKNIVIEGHCDERGTREYNLALGERRARGPRQDAQDTARGHIAQGIFARGD